MNKSTYRCIAFLSLIFVFVAIFGFCALADQENNYYTEREILVVSEGELLTFDTSPVIIEGRTMVPLRTILESFDCEIFWDEKTSTVKASDKNVTLEIKTGSGWATVYTEAEIKSIQLDVPAVIINSRTYLPLRKIAEIFGAYVFWDDEANTVTLIKNLNSDFVNENHTYYFQNEDKWQFPNFGSGYCWVCSYAMVINDIIGGITPVDVSKVNEEYLGDGSLCYHCVIVENFGLKFVPALDVGSDYFEKYERDYGATYLKNEEKSDVVATIALTEALKKHPEGVLVRFEEYPHTIVAIGNVNGEIIFNDPSPNGWGRYSDEGSFCGVKFKDTYPYKMGLKLSDMAYVQAID